MNGAKPASWIPPSARTRRAVSPLASSKSWRANARSKRLRGRVAGPGLLRRPGVAEPRIAEQIVVPEVAPIGDEQALGAVTPSGSRVARDVRGAVLEAREQAVPRRRARAHPEADPVLGEALDAVVVVVRLVPPVEQHEIARDLGDPRRVRVDDVAPDQRLLAVLLREAPHPLDVLEIDAARPERPRALARSSPARGRRARRSSR